MGKRINLIIGKKGTGKTKRLVDMVNAALQTSNGNVVCVEKGAILTVDKLNAEKGAKIDIDSVLLVSDGDKISVGTPYVKGAKVQVVVEDSFRDKKVIVLKYKSKKDYHRVIGHRQQYTNVRVEDITLA